MKIFRTITFKITVGIVFVTTIILISISLFSFTAAQNEFQNAATRLVGPNGNVIFVRSIPVLTLDQVRRDFNERLENSIVTGGVVGISVALVLGLFFSIIITKPIEKLKEGISYLRESKYKYKMEKTGEVELDSVIDEFNSLTTELSAQEELRKDLISDVSHELKTPLTSILGQVQGIREGIFEPDKERLETIQKDAERLTSLVNLLQEYTRLRSKTLNLNLQEVNLYTIIDHIANSHQKDLSTKKIKLENNINKTYELNADETLLQRIAENIIDNAIKYSQAKTISVSIKNNKLIITDDGIGIPKEDLKRIFERFYRVEKSRNRSTGGLGLGLSLVKEMVEAHGWEIEAFNNEKAGVRFEIKLAKN